MEHEKLISQSEFARRVGTSAQYINKIRHQLKGEFIGKTKYIYESEQTRHAKDKE